MMSKIVSGINKDLNMDEETTRVITISNIQVNEL
jgi:hypothetical protein